MPSAVVQDLEARLTAVRGVLRAVKRAFINPQSAIRPVPVLSGNPHSKGFTLIETIITLVVLSIAAVGVLSVFTTGISGSANPLVIDQATQLAQEKMDTILGDRANTSGGRGFDWVVAADYNTNISKYPPEDPISSFAGFTRSVLISCVTTTDLNASTGAPPCASGYAHVTVDVANELIGTVSIESLVAKYE